MGNIRNYFLYAIGEIILVVIGILIALQINNWKNNTIERNLEIEYLNRLASDLRADTTTIKFIIQLAEGKMEDLKFVFQIVNTMKIDAEDTIKFLNACVDGTSLGWYQPNLSENTIQDLLNTGNMKIITNVKLRSQILNYYRDAENQNGRIQSRRGAYPSITYEVIPRSLAEEEGEFAVDTDNISTRQIINNIFESNLPDHIISELNLANFIHEQYLFINELALELLENIQSELERMK